MSDYGWKAGQTFFLTEPKYCNNEEDTANCRSTDSDVSGKGIAKTDRNQHQDERHLIGLEG